MANLLFINVDENINKAKPLLNNKGDFTFVYLNNKILENSSKHILLDDVVKQKTYYNIYKNIVKFKKSWYKQIEKDFKYFNLSLFELIEANFLRLWPTFLKIEIFLDLIKKNNPKKIEIITEDEEDIKILEEILKNKKITLNRILLKKSIKKLSFKKNINNKLHKLLARFQNFLFNYYSLNDSTKKKILVIGNLRQLSPLLKKLKENKDNLVIRGGEKVGRGLFSKYCHHYLTFEEYNNKEIIDKTKSLNKWLNENLEKLMNNVNFKNSLNYKINLFNVLESKLRNSILTDFVNLIKYIEITKKLGLNMVITHNDILPFEKTVVKTANELKIPTLTLLEGFLSEKRINEEKKRGSLFLPFSADKMTVYSKNQKDAMVKNYPEIKGRVLVTGFPLFDNYYNARSINKEEIYKRYKIPLNKKIVLYTAERYTNNLFERPITSPFTKKQFEDFYEELLKTITDFKNVFLLIKIHPSGSLDDEITNKIAKKLNVKNYAISKDMDIHNLLNASFAVVTRVSTMGLETMFVRKPLVVMDTYFNTNDYTGYTSFGAALHAKNPGDLKKLLKGLLENKLLIDNLNKNMDKFIKYNYSVNDGNSSLRIYEAVKKMIEHGKN